MRRPVALFVGLRYLRTRSGGGFASFVSAASVIGVSLGVATLIIVLSVMNGFENELRGRLLGLTSHASIQQEGGVENWPPLVRDMLRAESVTGAAPFIETEGMLSGPGGLSPAIISGIQPDLENTVSTVQENMLIGSLADLKSGSNNVVLGRALAQRLGIAVGSRLTLLVPKFPEEGGGMQSGLIPLTVVGVFELGVQDHDGSRAVVHLEDAAVIAGMGAKVSGVRIETTDIFSAPQTVREALEVAGGRDGSLYVYDWTQQNASYFRAIRIEKIMMALLLSLIIGVAAFNIVATLVMVVTEKRPGIAILRTLGCSKQEIVRIFILQGTLIGWAGALIGVLLGVVVTLNIETLAPAIEGLFGFQFMPADLYYLTELPYELRISDVVGTALAVLAITAAATVYPSMRAAAVEPAEVLRYE
ncbi:MAG: lipoprotein-releasing ABC transporter permease subunit [Gammaproteobacteria bacterium]